MKKKIIGILGGMGPLATADLFKKIIELTEAAKDQDHVRVIIDSNTNIPDRTAAILHGGADPVPALTESATLLEKAGAGFLIMPCNTAHYFYKNVCEAVSIPVISIIEETAKRVLEIGYDTVLILATDGTIQSKVYEKVFDTYGIRSVYPDPETQKGVMDVIYKGVKAGITDLSGTDEVSQLLREDTSRINSCIKKTSEEFGGKVIAALACTELPMAKDYYGFEGVFTDPTENLAKAAIRAAGYSVKE
ncbi:MAG: amino acid racemase [Lachnospiraceae bacterium]|nr:amino acid racemase [Lachnospiraceae bacterium]